MDEITKKKKARGAHRGSATKIVSKINEKIASGNTSDINWLKQSRVSLSEKLERLRLLDEEIFNLMTGLDSEDIEEDLAREVEESDNLRAELSKVLIDIDDVLKLSEQTLAASISPPHVTPSHSVKAKLPKLEVKKFSGQIHEWQEFWDSFDCSIHRNESLSTVDKFNYLKGLLSEQAKSTIAGFALTAANYESAVDLLKARYGKKNAIQRAHINELMKIQAVYSDKDTERLRKMYDTCESHHRGLKALCVDEESYSSIVVPSVIEKLPENFRLTITRGVDFLDWSLTEMLNAFIKELELREIHSAVMGSSSPKKSFSQVSTNTFLTTKKLENCAFCLKQHAHEDCKNVEDLDTRKKIVRKYSRCFLCLRKNHLARDCKANISCKGCGGKHHTALCDTRVTQPQPKAVGATISSSGMHVGSGGKVVLQTARGVVKGLKDIKVRVLFDSGSHRSFITASAVEIIKPRVLRQEWLAVSTFGQKCQKASLRDVVQLDMRNMSGESVTKMEVFVVPEISSIQNSHVEVAKSNFSHLRGLWFSDVSKNEAELEIDVLVGSDYLWDFMTNNTRRGRAEEPVAVETKLGWVLSGPLCEKDIGSITQVNFVCQEKVKLDNTKVIGEVRKLWDLDTVGIREADEVHEGFLDTVSYTGDRYSVKLPWKQSHDELYSNYSNSLARMNGQIRRLKKQPEVLAEYDSIIKQQSQSGVIERVVSLEKEGKVHYLPHQGVIRKDSTTTKLRIVYDASCKGSNGVSLNDCLHVGPSLTPLLFDILIRFRCYRVALVADIEKAFLNIEVDEADRDSLRFLWVDDVMNNNFNLVVYRFCRVVFGLNSSPFLLNATLRHHISGFEAEDSQFVRKMLDSFYVDDLVTGESDKKKAQELYEKTIERLGEGGFRLRKWMSNDSEMRKSIDSENNRVVDEQVVTRLEDEESYAKSTLNSPMNTKGHKVLGLLWDVQSDQFKLELSSVGAKAQMLEVTKRNMLSILAGIFDPLGVLSPVVVCAKVLFQEACSTPDSQWDKEVSKDIKLKWEEWCQDLGKISEIEISRCVFKHGEDEISQVYLHGFSDASKKAYCAVIYLVYQTAESFQVRLLASKTRVAPLKSLSIPRLELVAARILAQLMNAVVKALETEVKVTGTRLWSDSKTVLYWVRNKGEWKQFVQHRVNEILRLTKKSDWGYCPGQENPADLGSRGVMATKLVGDKLWWQGPDWLAGEQSEWPVLKEQVKVTEVSEEERKSAVLVVQETKVYSISSVVNLDRYSRVSKAIKVAAWVRRFIHNLRVNSEQRRSGRLEIEELKSAEREWIQDAQLALQNQNNYNQLKVSLGLVLEDGILRCKGRLANSDLEFDGRHPMILPKNHRFTQLVIEECHEQVQHSGVRATLANLRSRFWVPKGRQQVKKIVGRCVVCKRLEGRPYRSAATADLPEFRVKESPPFMNTGVDFAGPLLIKGGTRDPEKVYIALFTCCATRAVHLDLVADMSAAAFIRCLRKFVSRRGTPALMISDNAKTFRATDKKLTELFEHPEIKADLEARRIVWKFNLERAPWWGGFFERMVGSVKRNLRKVLGNSLLTHDELLTVLVEVESTLNTRPLTYSYDDPEAEVLTPSHLIFGRRLTLMPDVVVEEDLENETDSNKRFKYLSLKLGHFWSRWRKEYLTDLREFHRSRNSENTGQVVKEGDVVIIDGEGKKRSCWKMGVVEGLVRGRDGEVRGANVRLIVKGKRKIISRPLQKLYPLEICTDVKKTKNKSRARQVQAQQSRKGRYPRRHAAVKALSKIKALAGEDVDS